MRANAHPHVCISLLRGALRQKEGLAVDCGINNLAPRVNTEVPDLLEGVCIHTHK